MKKNIFFFAIILFHLNVNGKEVNGGNKISLITVNEYMDTATYPITDLTLIDLPFYYNKPINIFLADLTTTLPGYFISPIYSKDNLRMGTKINIYYSNNICFVITVKDFLFMNSFSENADFDINLFRQENIFKIELWNDSSCINGCH